MDSNIQYEKELNLDILYKKNRVGYITADFYIPKQKVFNISEDIVIETKQSWSTDANRLLKSTKNVFKN